MVAGHPLKGGSFPMSTGLLLNPEIKRFAIASPLFFKPVRPGAGVGDQPVQHTFAESSNQLVEAYTGSNASWGSEKATGYRFNLDRCFANSVAAGRDPESVCQYYIQGLKRSVATAN